MDIVLGLITEPYPGVSCCCMLEPLVEVAIEEDEDLGF
jgi:hypothetical protein